MAMVLLEAVHVRWDKSWRGLLPPALTFPRPTLPRKQPFVLVNMRQRQLSFFQNGDDNDEFSALLSPALILQ